MNAVSTRGHVARVHGWSITEKASPGLPHPAIPGPNRLLTPCAPEKNGMPDTRPQATLRYLLKHTL